ncbi:phage tail tape measure protein [uncultured Megasphaera sp.]|uniref:phage tail tape measure protein n=1 Tax=uncultured Megasphaera sp. TaxID=165188 RepID=UPI0025EFF204|nr:phage tail tape measure protein [uncultured Megasphaera sp.]
MAQIIDVVMRLTDNVTGGLNRIRNAMEQSAKANQRMGRTLQNAGRHVGNLSDAMMPLAAGITGVGALGVKTFMDFDATMTAAGVKAGATAEEMQQMKDAAAQMGAKFPTTARDVALGMDRLAAGGFNAEQTIGAMPGIIEASIASGEDLATTSDVITSALSIWNLTQGDVADNTTHVADVVQAAANASKLGMQDFGLAMQYAGAPAAALGINIEELATAMGIMSNNGIEASTIGTSIRSTLSRLADPPKAAATALDRLGISMADLQKGDGSFIGLSGAVELLRSKMSGLSDTEQVAMAKAIAGEDAYSGLLALIKTSPEAYQQMSDAITNSAGSSHEAYLQMQNTLKGSVDALQSSLEALGISFGSALAPTIRDVAADLKGIADAFTSMSPESKQMIISIGEAVVAVTALTFATSKVLGVAGSVITTYGQIGRVLAGHTIRNKALQYAVLGVAKALPILRSGIIGIANGFRVALAAMGPVGIAFAAVGAIAAYVIANWETFGPIVSGIWQGVVETFNRAYTGISGIIDSIIQTVSGIIDYVGGTFAGAWDAAWNGIVSSFSSIFGGIQSIASGILDGIKSAINAVIRGINSISVDIPSWVPGVGGNHFGMNIPYLASGTDSWQGGFAVINEKGGEIVDLPQGSRVMPHDQSVKAAYNMGTRSRNDGITVNIIGTTINNGEDIKELARKVAEQIHFEMEKEAINSTVGGI